jgi:hypothetical protein
LLTAFKVSDHDQLTLCFGPVVALDGRNSWWSKTTYLMAKKQKNKGERGWSRTIPSKVTSPKT